MHNLLLCFNAVAPQFLLLLLGVFARRTGALKEEHIPIVNGLAFKMFTFFIVFNGIVTADLSAALRPRLTLVMALAFVVPTLLAIPVLKRVEPDPRACGVLVESVFHVNYIIMAIPIVTSLAGPAGGAAACALVVVSAVFENTLAALVLTYFNGGRVSAKSLIIDLLKNPLILACVAAFAVLLSGLRLPAAIAATSSQMAAAGGPLCMLCLGATLRLDRIRAAARKICLAVIVRLVATPALVIPCAILAGLRGADLAIVTVAFSAPVAATAYPVCHQLGGDSDLMANIVVFTTLLGCFAIFLYTFLLKQAGLI